MPPNLEYFRVSGAPSKPRIFCVQVPGGGEGETSYYTPPNFSLTKSPLLKPAPAPPNLSPRRHHSIVLCKQEKYLKNIYIYIFVVLFLVSSSHETVVKENSWFWFGAIVESVGGRIALTFANTHRSVLYPPSLCLCGKTCNARVACFGIVPLLGTIPAHACLVMECISGTSAL